MFLCDTVNDDRTVTFRLRAPKAESVALSGAMTTVMGVRGNIPFIDSHYKTIANPPEPVFAVPAI